MANNEVQYSLAEMKAYLQGELPAAKLQEMEASLLTDPLLAGAMEALEESLDSQPRDTAELEALTASFRHAIPGNANIEKAKSASVRRFNTSQLLRYAAVAILLITGGWFIWQNLGGQASSEELFAMNFSPYEDVITARSGEETDALLKEAMRYYNASIYPQALATFEKILVTDPEQPFVLLYAGISGIAANQPAKALDYLTRLNELKHPVLQDISLWYTAMAHLKNGDQANAKDVLNGLLTSKTAYGEQAKQLLERLQNID